LNETGTSVSLRRFTTKTNGGPLVIIVVAQDCDDKTYLRDPTILRERFTHCLLCQKPMGRNGWYQRPLPLGDGWQRGPIFRRLCRRCNVSFTLFPVFVVARRRYSLVLMAAWLLAWLHGTPVRDRTFLVGHALVIPVEDKTLSWSDLLDCEPTRPSYQLLFRWARDFQRRAASFLEHLVPAADWCALDLQNLAHLLEGEAFSAFRASPVVLAAGLLHLLPRPGPDPSTIECLSELVRMLCARRLPPSHQILRVSGGRFRYDTLVV